MSEDKPIMLTNPKEIELKDKVDESVDIFHKQIRNKKEAIVKLKLKEKGLLHILKNIDKQRFPKMMIEMHKDKEIVWIDNGTFSGLKLVTFWLMEPTIKDGEEGSVFNTKLLYE